MKTNKALHTLIREARSALFDYGYDERDIERERHRDMQRDYEAGQARRDAWEEYGPRVEREWERIAEKTPEPFALPFADVKIEEEDNGSEEGSETATLRLTERSAAMQDYEVLMDGLPPTVSFLFEVSLQDTVVLEHDDGWYGAHDLRVEYAFKVQNGNRVLYASANKMQFDSPDLPAKFFAEWKKDITPFWEALMSFLSEEDQKWLAWK